MIEIQNLTKKFHQYIALDQVNATIEEGHVFGLIGTNGAGKSTLLRILSGIYKGDEGIVLVDGEPIFENAAMKANIFYISDDQYFFTNGTAYDMMKYYKNFYPKFETSRFLELLSLLHLDKDRKINTYSKGMKKQLSVLLGICAHTKYLLCDETFDGLDPVIRQAVKRLFLQEMETRKMTPIIASHNLRELEDICEHIGLLHKGGILFSKDLETMKLGIYKVQCVFKNFDDILEIERRFTILNIERRGSLITCTLRGNKNEIEACFTSLHPAFFELLPLSLEEIFISETEVLVYEFKNLFLS